MVTDEELKELRKRVEEAYALTRKEKLIVLFFVIIVLGLLTWLMFPEAIKVKITGHQPLKIKLLKETDDIRELCIESTVWLQYKPFEGGASLEQMLKNQNGKAVPVPCRMDSNTSE